MLNNQNYLRDCCNNFPVIFPYSPKFQKLTEIFSTENLSTEIFGTGLLVLNVARFTFALFNLFLK